MAFDFFGLGRFVDVLDERRTDGIGHTDMRDAAGTEEGFVARDRAVDELIGQHEFARLVFFLQRAYGGNGNEIGDAGALQGIDIGAVIDFTRRDCMPAPVTRKKSHRQSVQFREEDLIGRRSPRTGDRLPMRAFETGQRIKAAAADNTQNRLDHRPSHACHLMPTTQYP